MLDNDQMNRASLPLKGTLHENGRSITEPLTVHNVSPQREFCLSHNIGRRRRYSSSEIILKAIVASIGMHWDSDTYLSISGHQYKPTTKQGGANILT